LAGAAHQSLGELRDECARVKAAAEPDPPARHAAIHAARCARQRRCPDGGGEILYRSTLDEVAEIWAVVQGYANRVFAAARTEGRREPVEAYGADGLLAMARAAAGGDGRPGESGAAAKGARAPVPAKLLVRVDWPALVRGWPTGGELCEIAGVGPVPVSVVRAMIDSGDPFLAAIVTRGVDVVSVAHLGRRPTVHQASALQWRDPVCTVLGCNLAARLEVDHRDDWALTLKTWLPGLDRLREHHHDLKTRSGWALVAGTGKRAMVPPGHPDHPGTTTDRAPPAA
jgi:hypothetical protein